MKVLLCLALLFCQSAYAQEEQELPETAIPETVIIELRSLPDIEVGVADIIDILTEFDIIEEDNPSFCYQFYGLTDYTSKTISICSRYDMTQRRKTILHEILHVMYHKIGWDTGGPYEPFIHAKAETLFLKLYRK